MATAEPTAWAPSQHRGMTCACPHWNARECLRSRSPINPFDDPDSEAELFDSERCDCCCHDRDQDSDEDELT